MTFDDILQFGVRGGFAVAEVLAGVTLIILLCAFLVLAARRRSAALRHRVWALSAIGAVCLPLFAAVLPDVGPRLHITIPPPRNASDLVIVSDVPQIRVALPLGNQHLDGGLEPAARLNEAAISSDRSEIEQLVGHNSASPSRRTVAENASIVSPAAEETHSVPSASSTRRSAWSLLFGVWLLGVFITAALFLRDILLSRALVRRAMPVTHEDAVRLKDQLCRSAGVTADIPLLCSPETSVPLTVGRLHPVILLPSGFSQWPEDRWRVALAHEIAHIERRDVLWQGIARPTSFISDSI